MQGNLSGRRMIITGASSGIGRCLAEQAALQGAWVALAARSTEKLHDISQSLSSRGAVSIAIPTNITEAADRQRLLETVVKEFGGLDTLINNAGIGSFGHFASSSEEILRRV